MQVVHVDPDRPIDVYVTTPAPLPYVPALDGIRAVAVSVVLLYHGGVTWAPGGFLGVSVFFTLSGFLITSLLLREWTGPDASGTHHNSIDLTAFWARRVRRLVAASWITIGAVVAMGALGAWESSQLHDLRTDVPWSLADLVNWHFIVEGTSYAATQSPPSPLQHFWSLAIEEQLYLLFPLLLVGLLVRGPGGIRRRRRRAAATIALLVVASAALNGVLARTSVDRAYFGTDTRAAELLIGALIAFAMIHRTQLVGRARHVAVSGALPAAVVLAVLVHTTGQTSPWLYPWGLLVTATCSGALVVAAMQPGLPARILSLAPLVALGRISYGVYLLHWPAFLWLTPTRTGLEGWMLLIVRVVTSITAAAFMYRLVERPVRERVLITPRQARVVLPAGAVVLLASSCLVTRGAIDTPDFLEPRPSGEIEIREAPTTAVPLTDTAPTSLTSLPDTAGPEPTTAPDPGAASPPAPSSTPPSTRHPRRVLLIGDSVAYSLEDALAAALNRRGISFVTAASPGCGVLSGFPADEHGQVIPGTASCDEAVPKRQRDAVARTRPDLVVLMSTWEGIDRVVDDRLYRIGTPEADRMLHRLYGETIARTSVGGAGVAILTIPHPVDGRTHTAKPDDLRRIDIVNEVIRVIGASAPGVSTIEWDRIVCPGNPCPPVVDGTPLRPGDGIHFDESEGARLASERLADKIAALDLDRL